MNALIEHIINNNLALPVFGVIVIITILLIILIIKAIFNKEPNTNKRVVTIFRVLGIVGLFLSITPIGMFSFGFVPLISLIFLFLGGSLKFNKNKSE